MARFVCIAVLCCARLAAAEECRVVDVDFTPTEKLQIVAWIEDAAGNYVDTAFITQSTGLRGIGNRTGIMDLQSGPLWPYGVREDVLPIWAHRHGFRLFDFGTQTINMVPQEGSTKFKETFGAAGLFRKTYELTLP